jgi:hypothetical protein
LLWDEEVEEEEGEAFSDEGILSDDDVPFRFFSSVNETQFVRRAPKRITDDSEHKCSKLREVFFFFVIAVEILNRKNV